MVLSLIRIQAHTVKHFNGKPLYKKTVTVERRYRHKES